MNKNNTINQLDLTEALDLPEEGWVLVQSDGRWVGIVHEGAAGLCFFTDQSFSDFCEKGGRTSLLVSFDRARLYAQSKQVLSGVVIFRAGQPVGFHWVK